MTPTSGHSPDSLNDRNDKPARGAEVLPPVQPPEARFLMQLFVTPLLIVSMIVGVFFLATWLSRPHERPEALVARIERLDHRSWQQALALANQLRDESSGELRSDQVLAKRISDLLTAQLQLKSPSTERVRLQIYLCRVLGEFNVNTGLAALVKAASPDPAWRDPLVRRSALQAIGMLQERLDDSDDSVFPSARDVLFAALGTNEQSVTTEERKESARLRSTAAYVLGLFPNPAAQQRLELLLDDSEPDVRFNAATGLARQGNPQAVTPLLRMLQLESPADSSVEGDSPAEARQKRDLITSAAIRAVLVLHEQRPELDLDSFQGPIETISQDATIAQTVQREARDALHLLFTANPQPPSS